MSNEPVFRLAPPKKGGLLSLIFSRFLIIFLLLLAQAAFYVFLFLRLREYYMHFTIFIALFTLTMTVYLFLSDTDASAKLTWLLIIVVLPFFGAFLYLYTRINLGHRVLKRRAAATISQTMHAIQPQPEIMDELARDGGDVDDLVKYLSRTGCFPVYKNTEVQYFPLGEEMFEAMLTELKKAERFIFLEYFIISEGYMWGEILRILMEKAAAGVDVRVMYDGMCEMSTLPAKYWKLLEEKGIRSRPFAPIMPVLSSHYNYRDHRKILVIDGKTAFNGGVNMADEYINRIVRFGHWKDTAVMLKGDAVKSFTLMFLQMWNINEKEQVYESFIKDTGFVPKNPSGYVLPYADCPLDNERVGESVYIDMLYRAGDYVHIMTPYLILDGELAAALKYAAKRGIDVKLILPGVPDKKGAFALAKTHYRALTAAGVDIREYTPGFVHAKVAVSDNERAVVGTINMDYRSLYHHFECATYLYKTDCIEAIEQDFQQTLGKCRKVTAETIRHEKISYVLLGLIMKFIAPLM